MLLRLEDLDATRVREDLVEACLEDLRWLGMDWDGEPLLQSSRAQELRSSAEELLAKGLAYPCVCTRAEVRDAITAPHGSEDQVRYPGTCRGLFSSTERAREESGREPALRFLTPDAAVSVHDLISGEVDLHPHRDLGDFPITSRDGQVAYHLAVVLDDAHQGVTEVLRGDDLLASCGPQAALQDALGLARPDWVHVPLVTDANGQRLAKRTDGLSLRALRDAGVDPEHLIRWLAITCGLPDLGPITPQGAVSAYRLDLLPRTPLMLEHDLVDRLARGELPGSPVA